MAAFKEKIEIYSVATTADGAGGIVAGAETLIDTQFRNMTEKQLSRTNESGQLVFHKVLIFSLFVNAAYTLTPAHVLKFRGKVLKIHSMTLGDNLKQYYITGESIQ